MTDAGEKLEQRMMNYGILAECQESALKFVRDELERAESDLGKLAKGKVRSYAAAIDDAVAAIRKLKE